MEIIPILDPDVTSETPIGRTSRRGRARPESAVIPFRLDPNSRVPPYLQLVVQVRAALLVGELRAGDRLPTVREVSAQVGLNSSTVLRAYRALAREGLTDGRRGIGTFITHSLGVASLEGYDHARNDLEHWIASVRQLGLDDDSIAALVERSLHADARSRTDPEVRAQQL